ncbi:ATPase [Candidatus Micrarchaeota archaeon]|nr:ATPase [Candidatus Micrarchaeota archaeon]
MEDIIKRRTEDEKINNAGNWLFIYGRRKTGKTFYVKKFMKWDEYFFVAKDSSIIYKNENITFSEFFIIFKSLINDKTIVVDEFHRLPPIFLDYLHSIGTTGKLILISSTLWLSQKLLKLKYPLIGLFYDVPFTIIDERDILINLKIKDKIEFIETAVYLREPILIQHYNPPIRKFLTKYLIDNKMSIQGLIGEIFREEDKHLSKVYDGIMRAVASGKGISSEISSYLFSRGLIKKDNPGLIQGYLNNLVSMGILQKESVFNKKKFVYSHVSPFIDLFFYVDEKYGLLETQVSEKFISDVIDKKIPFHIEYFVKLLLSKIYGMKPVKIEEPEIDIALVSFKKIKVVGEVKWKKVTMEDIKKIEEKFSKFNAEKLLIVKNKKGLKSDVLKIFEIKDLLKINIQEGKSN